MSSENEISIGADVNSEELMQQIREEVIRKRREGAYPPEVAAEVDSVIFGLQDDGVDAQKAALGALQGASNFSPYVGISWRRRGLGIPIGLVKRLIRKLVGWYFVGVIEQLNTYAQRDVQLQLLFDRRIDRLEAKLNESLEASSKGDGVLLEELRRELGEVKDRITSSNVENRMAGLDRAVRRLGEMVTSPSPPSSESVTATEQAPKASRDSSRDVELSFDYPDFEDVFRGSREEIYEKQRHYVRLFEDASRNVVDLGCGRGEFLELLKEAGIPAYGVDRHPDMVSFCRESGLEVVEADSLEHLRQLDEESLGGIFCAQMIEHLSPSQIVSFFELASAALAPAGVLVVETPNPQSLMIFASAFYVDFGHTRPYHPLSLEFLAKRAGFSSTEIQYISPVPADRRPTRLQKSTTPVLEGMVEQLNRNFEAVDQVLFGPQDYALIARR